MPIEPYSICLEEFITIKPEVLQPYSLDKRIVRPNFVGYIAFLFGKTQADITEQQVITEWLGYHTGFDTPASMGNYYGAGGWECLSETEQLWLYKSYQVTAPVAQTSYAYAHKYRWDRFGEIFDETAQSLAKPARVFTSNQNQIIRTSRSLDEAILRLKH